jgi:PTH1 family peptidyl-tRNA hydrolase
MVDKILRVLERMGMAVRGTGRPSLEGAHSVVLGLGNPGSEYSNTRHNAGANVVRQIVREKRARLRKAGRYVRAARIDLGEADPDAAKNQGKRVDAVAAIPLTFMNESGIAAAWLVERCDIPVERLLVVHDDMDLPLGSVRAKFGGGSGGHRGVESVIKALGSNAFQRIRVGIGRPSEDVDAVDFVLSPFDPSEEELARKSISVAAEAVRMAIVQGIDAAMNFYNSPGSGVAD